MMHLHRAVTQRCPVCAGSGRVRTMMTDGSIAQPYYEDCPACGGTGWVPGRGRVAQAGERRTEMSVSARDSQSVNT